MEDRVLFRRRAGRHELEQLDRAEIPPVRLRDPSQLARALGQRHVQPLLTTASALEQELEGERRLSRARLALDEVEMVRGQATTKDRIETGDPGERTIGGASSSRSGGARFVGHVW